MTLRVCVDFGSTYTKACVVDLGTPNVPASARVLARASHRTTVDTDVLEGWDACLSELVREVPAAAAAPVLACSSAGGGLRIGVVGNEQLVTSEAGRRVALSSGGRVVHVASGPLDGTGTRALVEARPDVLLLAGGTDGGNAEVLLHNAHALAAAAGATSGPDADAGGIPVVVAGNADAAGEVARVLTAAGVATQTCANVMPRIGAFTPEPARAALRSMFLSHVIGGKSLSAGDTFAAMVRGATPDLMLAAVELLAHGPGGPRGPAERREGRGDVAVVDVGGATTDVYSVVEVDPESAGRDVVGLVPASRTVEGDLGMRWSAVPTVHEALAAGLVPPGQESEAERQARARQADPGMLADDGYDLQLAGWAAAVAVRRHAGRAQVRFEHGGSGPARLVERTGTDLREVAVLVGSGGVLRHAPDPAAARATLTECVTGAGAAEGGWQVPEHPRVVLDRDYLLMPAGLLATEHPESAYALLEGLF